MKEYDYYAIFLTEESKNKLRKTIKEDVIINRMVELSNGLILDHCTLLHHKNDNPRLREHLDKLINTLSGGQLEVMLSIIGVGVSDYAMAFKVEGVDVVCNNKVPHITICTFSDGEPADSNYIEHWTGYKRINVKGVLKRINRK